MNSRKFFALFGALTLVAASLVAPMTGVVAQKQSPPAGGAPKPFTLPRKEEFKLKNGMTVTLVPYGSIPKAYVSAVVRSGNMNEPADKVWLADLTGDLMGEGTTTRSSADVDAEASRMGGSLGIGTGLDTSNVGIDVLGEYAPDAVRLVADVLTHPLLPESELARLKTDRLRNLSIQKSQPGSLALERFRKVLYGEHPYGRIFPTEQMINSVNAADVRKFYADNFGAQRTHLYVAGQFNAAQVRKAITQAFGKWAKGAPAIENVPRPTSERKIYLIDRPGAPQSTIYLGLPVVDPSHKDYVPLAVTNSILGGSFGSRITSNIREQKGYTYSPNSSISSRYRDAYWVEVADVTTAVTGPSLKEIFYEIDRLHKEPPPEAELQGIKNYMAGIFTIQNSSRQGIIGQLAFLDLHRLPDTYLTNYVQNILNVAPGDVQRIMQTYVRPERMTIVVVGDREKIAKQIEEYGTVVL
ncbi:MAG: insulinase family protein [Acidobacteria bacterium]|nr:insulinase family protein [Acidobacteriota bacterium]